MGETCERCGRPLISRKGYDEPPYEAHLICWGTGGPSCEVAAAAYRRGIDEGVRLAKEHVVTFCHDCRWKQTGSDDYGPEWDDVDAAAAKAKGEA